MKKLSLGQLGDFEIKQLKIFKSVVDCAGFSAAEAELNISRPTISNHIANLEKRLNMTLCKRGRGGFSLTPEGSVIYEQTNQLIGQLEQFRSTINNLGPTPTGLLKIALSDTLSTDERSQLPEILRQFHAQAPDVELRVEIDRMHSMEKMVLNNQLDIAIIPYHRKLEGLDYIHLFSDKNHLYCGQQHPLFNIDENDITETMINSCRMIHAGLKPHEEAMQQHSKMKLCGSSYHYESRIALLRSGCFICFLPENYAAPYVERGEIKAIAQHLKHYTLGVAVISKRSSQPNRAKSLFLEAIRQVHNRPQNLAPY